MKIINRINIYGPSTIDPYFKVKFKINGKWHLRKRKTLQEAEELRKELKSYYAGGDPLACITKRDKEKLNAALNLLPEGHCLFSLIQEYLDAKDCLPDEISLKETAKFYADFHSKGVHLTFGELIEKFLAKKASEWSESHLKAQKNLFNRIKTAFPTQKLANISTEMIDLLLCQLKDAKPKTRNHLKAAISKLLNFAVKLNALPNMEAFKLVLEHEKFKTVEPEILSPAEFKNFLKYSSNELLPFLVFGGFAGLRPEEIKRLTWEQYWMHEDVLVLSGSITKTSTMRQIPKKEALKKWVNTFAKKKGNIVTISDTSKSKQLSKLKNEFGGPIGKDSQGRDLFRHCYASYRFGECKSPNTVSDETGHSVSVLKNNYLKMTSTSDSKQWFGMLPENILQKKENNNDIKPKTIIRTSKGFNSNNYKIHKQTQNPLHANWQKCQI